EGLERLAGGRDGDVVAGNGSVHGRGPKTMPGVILGSDVKVNQWPALFEAARRPGFVASGRSAQPDLPPSGGPHADELAAHGRSSPRKARYSREATTGGPLQDRPGRAGESRRPQSTGHTRPVRASVVSGKPAPALPSVSRVPVLRHAQHALPVRYGRAPYRARAQGQPANSPSA